MATPLPPFNRLKIGDFVLTTLVGGAMHRENPQQIFGVDASREDFEAAAAENFLSPDVFINCFSPMLVETGAETVLFDTGLTAEGITTALAAAGKTPADIDVVIVTHMHGDHVGGLMGASGPTFPNARIIAGALERDHWAGTDAEAYVNKVVPLHERTTYVEPGDTPLPGFTAVEAYGHTPGHLAWMVESRGEKILNFADATNHYVWSLAHPEWEVVFDVDKDQAKATRLRVLGMLADEKIPAFGYHMPWPCFGHVARDGDGFRWVPMTYQPGLSLV